MPHLILASAAGNSQRRLVSETVKRESEKGYSLSVRREGGEWKDLLTSESAAGLFAERRLVLVEEAQSLGKFPQGLESLLEGPGALVHVLLVYPEEPRSVFGKDLYPRLTWLKAEEIPRFGSGKQRWAENEARKLGISISPDALALLLESVEDPWEVLSEMTKLSLAADDGRVELDLVRALCFDEGEKALLSLLDGLCEGDVRRVTAAMPHLRKRELIPLVAALHNRFRLAYYSCAFSSPKAGKGVAEILKARPYQERLATSAARRYGKEGLAAFVRNLCAVNIGEKNGNRNGWVELELSILALLASGKASNR